MNENILPPDELNIVLSSVAARTANECEAQALQEHSDALLARIATLEAQLEQAREALEEAHKNIREHRWADMTPNADLPIRLLSAYLDYSEWSDNSLELEPSNPLLVEMNRVQRERNLILEAALQALREGGENA